MPDVCAIRRQLHAHPEVGLQEFQTRKLVQEALLSRGIPCTPCYETGLVGLHRGAPGGRTLALRADMDAVAIQEETGCPFSSQVEGVMHACGHDMHTAILLGTAAALRQLAPDFQGNIKYLFQPAEETAGGAEGMVRCGAMEDPPVDRVLALHVWPKLPLGTAAVRTGPTMASFNTVRITLKGSGGHISGPHKAVNPIYVGMDLINAMQRIRTQRIDPVEQVVFDVASVHAGTTAVSVIPETFSLAASLRCYSVETARLVEREVARLLEGYRTAYQIDYTYTFKYGYVPVRNHPAAAQAFRDAAQAAGFTVVPAEPEFGAEDFGYFINAARDAEGALAFLGASDGRTAQLHSPHFLPGEEVLRLGMRLMCQAAADYLGFPL